METSKPLFADIPAALVDEVLTQSSIAGADMLKTLNEIDKNRKIKRDELIGKG